MTAQIINLQAWRLAHSESPDMRAELVRIWLWPVRIWLWPVRIWLAWWGIR